MKNWRIVLITGSKTLAVVKIHGDFLLPPLFVITMLSLSYILTFNPLTNMDDIMLFAKNEKELETLKQTIRIYNQVIGMEVGIVKCAILIEKSRKNEITERIELPNQARIRMFGKK